MFAGLPMRVVRHSTYEEAKENVVEDIWGDEFLDPQDNFFLVEVAD
jgi:hypothetical protein